MITSPNNNTNRIVKTNNDPTLNNGSDDGSARQSSDVLSNSTNSTPRYTPSDIPSHTHNVTPTTKRTYAEALQNGNTYKLKQTTSKKVRFENTNDNL